MTGRLDAVKLTTIAAAAAAAARLSTMMVHRAANGPAVTSMSLYLVLPLPLLLLPPYHRLGIPSLPVLPCYAGPAAPSPVNIISSRVFNDLPICEKPWYWNLLLIALSASKENHHASWCICVHAYRYTAAVRYMPIWPEPLLILTHTVECRQMILKISSKTIVNRTHAYYGSLSYLTTCRHRISEILKRRYYHKVIASSSNFSPPRIITVEHYQQEL